MRGSVGRPWGATGKDAGLDGYVILYTTWPDAETAQAVAAEAVAARLAACANLSAPMISIYRWEGAIEQAAEVTMILKTTSTAAPALRDLILARHPYGLPCVLSVNVDPIASSNKFLDWVKIETS
jgi:periplasmic divalent cation tolerance protein